MNARRMLFLTLEFPPAQPGGVATVAEQKVRWYASHGWHVDLVGPTGTSSLELSELEKGGRITITPVRGRSAPLRVLPLIVAALRVSGRQRPNLAYAISGTYPGIACLIVSIFCRVPFVVAAHGNEFLRFRNNFPVRALLRVIYGASRAILAVSSYTAGRIIRFGVDAEKVHVVHNAVDVGNFQRVDEDSVRRKRASFGANDQTILLLSISRLDPRKNHLRVLSALRILLDKQPEFEGRLLYLIGGTGTTSAAIDLEIRRLSLTKSVVRPGFVDDRDLPTLYTACDLFVLPVVYLPESGSVEGFGLTYLEAAACGLASLAGKTGGVSDAVIDGVTGVQVDGRSVTAIADALKELIVRKDLRERLGAQAKKRAVDEFSMDAVFEREQSLLLRLSR